MFGKGRRSGSYRSSRADGRRSRADGRRSNASRTSESDGIRNASGHSSTSTSRTSSTSVTDQSAFLTTPDPDPLPAQPQAPFFGVAFAPSHLPAFEPQQVGPGQAPFLFPGPHQGYYAASPAAGTDDGSHDGSDDSAASLAVSPGSPQSSNPENSERETTRDAATRTKKGHRRDRSVALGNPPTDYVLVDYPTVQGVMMGGYDTSYATASGGITGGYQTFHRDHLFLAADGQWYQAAPQYPIAHQYPAGIADADLEDNNGQPDEEHFGSCIQDNQEARDQENHVLEEENDDWVRCQDDELWSAGH
ncbi:uncharacterized protein THITE_2149978 [Thermothielavioides terrestris NRRL 8126]|uniref:Uncharacterized protein n=1 Tax=Thermothielavioides terrestris (strain ATCC 38088 / NRRL 8126) TaxID=578455 RepID=G2R0V8_THETT|nr:uncharacterized protein THITE_2149978 [Thermothielavioides terrestris NRRL 8126]AEO65652.1 hypothetical protein THITE_2149978 [Thermothielavioides terrestris NRRL 8126]